MEQSMQKRLLSTGCAALLAAFLVVGSAQAQTLPEPPINEPFQSDAPMPPAEMRQGTMQNWHHGPAERHEMWNQHPMMDQRRMMLHHEEALLEAEHESLRIECMDAKGQERSECERKLVNWKMRKDALMARMNMPQPGMEPRVAQMRNCTPAAPVRPGMPAQQMHCAPMRPGQPPMHNNMMMASMGPFETTEIANDNIGGIVLPPIGGYDMGMMPHHPEQPY